MGLTQMKADTASIITEWGETLTVKRASVTHTATSNTPTYNTSSTFSGDWQPVSGHTMRREEGRDVKSNSQIFCATTVDVQEGDRIYRADGTFEYVNYVLSFEDHLQIMTTRNKGSE